MTRNPKVGYGRLVGVMINGSAALEGVWKSHGRQEKELRISSLRQLRPPTDQKFVPKTLQW